MFLYAYLKINKDETNYNKENELISHYTVLIRSISLDGENLFQELDELLLHTKYVLVEQSDPGFIQDDQMFFDVNYPVLDDDKVELLDKRIKLSNEIRRNAEDLEKVEELNKEIVDLEQEIKESEPVKEINDVYITFKKKKYAHKLINLYKLNIFNRCCIRCCNRKRANELM